VSLTDGEVDASVSQYALRDLKPGTAYRVGIHEVAAGGGGTCSARWHFQTPALGNGGGPPPFLTGTLLCPIGHREGTWGQDVTITRRYSSPGVGTAVWSSNLKYLGISLGLPAAALIYQLSKKR